MRATQDVPEPTRESLASCCKQVPQICRLLQDEQEIKIQKDELAAADWHSLEKAEHYPLFQSGEMFRSIFAVCKAYANGQS